MTVHSPKTEHHEGKDYRVIPIFPELRPYLEAAFDEAPEGTKYVITIPNIRADKYANPRSTMQKIVKRAGLEPWPKLFHNLRVSRETELAATHPIHVVCEWIGNTPKVAKESYLRVTDDDYAKAIGTHPEIGEAEWLARRLENRKQNGNQPDIAGSSLLLQIVQKALETEGFEHVAATLSKALESPAISYEYPRQDSNL